MTPVSRFSLSALHQKHHSHASSRQTVGIAAVGKPHFPCIEQKRCARMKIQIPAIFIADTPTPRSNHVQQDLRLLRFLLRYNLIFNRCLHENKAQRQVSVLPMTLLNSQMYSLEKIQRWAVHPIKGTVHRMFVVR